MTMVIFLFISIYQNKYNDPLSKKTVRDLFGEEIELKLKSKHDFGGIDIHGDKFIFYEYDFLTPTLAFISEDKLKKLPTFNSGVFENTSIVDSNFAVRWTKMPIRKEIDSLLYQSTFSFLEVKSLKIDGISMEAKNLLSSDNFYSCISAKPIGNFFFILVPLTRKLYVVNKTG
jgi:hypothetical protein